MNNKDFEKKLTIIQSANSERWAPDLAFCKGGVPSGTQVSKIYLVVVVVVSVTWNVTTQNEI